jgi:protein ImuA
MRALGKAVKKRQVLADLRADMGRIVGSGSGSAASVFSLMDDPDFPTLAKGALHEVRGASHPDRPAALGFLMALIARLQGARDEAGHLDTRPLLWCEQVSGTLDFGTLYGPGLASFGLDPARFIVVRARTTPELMWAMEEGVRSGALSSVVGCFGPRADMDLTASRRLQLAAERTGTTTFLNRQWTDGTATVARSRWVITARLSSMVSSSCHNRARANVFSDTESNHLSQESIQRGRNNASSRVTESVIGLPCWRVNMEKCQGAGEGAKSHRPGTWEMEWDYETHCFRLVPPLVDRPVLPQHGADREGPTGALVHLGAGEQQPKRQQDSSAA